MTLADAGSKGRVAGSDEPCQGPPGCASARADEAAASSSQTTGAVGSRESSRSMMPPWPGSSVPMSLMPRSRLIIDSPRSPSVALAATARPSSRPCHHVPSSIRNCMHSAPATIANDTAPNRPSRVLPGLMRGASLCLPKRQPTAYAPVSLTTVSSRNVSTRQGPSSRGEQHRDERGEERHVERGEDARRDVPQVALGRLGHPPDQDRERGERHRDPRALGAADVPGDDHRGAADRERHQRRLDAACARRAGWSAPTGRRRRRPR